jgi:hypothetical protein
VYKANANVIKSTTYINQYFNGPKNSLPKQHMKLSDFHSSW